MVKLELPLDPGYVDWDVWAATREFLQNAKDEDTLGHPMKVSYRAASNTLRIENSGTILTTNTLVLGNTNKRNDSRMIGHFGEGYKLGALALLKRGLALRIYTGTDRWTPSIERSEKFGNAEILVWDIEGGRTQGMDKVMVEIQGLAPEVWAEIQDHVLWIKPPGDGEEIKTSVGSMLIGARFKGKLYVKGLYVGPLPGNYENGFNLNNVQLDRDRRLADPWSLSFALSTLWDEAMVQAPQLGRKFLSNLAQGLKDGGNVEYHSFSVGAREAIKTAFVEAHGKDAIPVGSLGEAQGLEHLGIKAAIVSREEIQVLRSIMPKPEEVKAEREKGAAKIWQWGELDEIERIHLKMALAKLKQGDETVSLDPVKIVDFFSPEILGTYRPANGDILLAKKVLSDPPELIATWVHEHCHAQGDDGSVGHERAIERLLSKALWNS